MLLVLAALIAAPQPVGDMPAFNPKAGQPSSCPATSRYEATGRDKKPRAQRLDELPDADLYLAVYRHIGRCEVPIIVKYGVGRR